VLQKMRRKRKHAASHFHRGHIFGFKFLGGKVVRPPRIDFGAAGKYINGREIVFGPGVNSEMRFGNHDHAGDAVRIKGMKNDIHDSGLGHFGGLDHNGFHFVNIVQDFGVAVVKFDEEVPSKRSQGKKNYSSSASRVNQFRTR
jgi:hypothetical protein